MAEIARSRVALKWDQGGPGVNTLYWTAGVPSPLDWVNSADQFHKEIGNTYSALQSSMVASLEWEVEPKFDIIDVESGNIIRQHVLDSEPVGGNGANSNTAATRAQQVCFNHYTDTWRNGRNLRGRTFLGPIGTGVVNPDGTFSQSEITRMRDAWTALISGPGPRLAVYHRPFGAQQTGGFYGDVVVVGMKKVPGILRSRAT
jgi:hypothetical protein